MPTVDQIRQRRPSRPVTVTSTADGRDHLLSEQATAAGSAPGHGRHLALCGHLVTAAPLVVPPGPTCWDCETALHRNTTTSPTSHRRGGLPARLLRWGFARTHSRSTIAGTHRARRA